MRRHAFFYRLFFSSLALCVCGALSKACLALPTTYFVNFTGTGTLPALGVFTYDADTASFSNFLVSWNDTLFDLTDEANAPYVSAPCPGESSSGATGFALLNKTLCAGTVYNWLADDTFGPDFMFYAGGGQPNRQIVINERQSDPTFGFNNGFGEWSLVSGIPGSFNYMISFTGTGILPALGVFGYDSNTESFSNFYVLWNGTLFDLTDEANAPYVSAPCPGESSSGATGFALLNKTLCAGTVYNWLADDTFGPDFMFYAGGGQPNRQIVINERQSDPTFGFNNGFGEWTISGISAPPPTTQIPEPATLWLLIAAMMLVTAVHRLKTSPGRDARA